MSEYEQIKARVERRYSYLGKENTYVPQGLEKELFDDLVSSLKIIDSLQGKS